MPQSQTYTQAELEQIRKDWLQQGLDTGAISNSVLVAESLGSPFIVDNWSGEHRAWRYANVEMKLYEYTTHHFFKLAEFGRPIDAWCNVRALVVRQDEIVVCRYKSCSDSGVPQGIEWEDAVFIPGHWTEIINRFVDQAQEVQNQRETENDDTEIIRLKSILHLD